MTRWLATARNPGFRGSVSSSTASTRYSPAKKQRLEELRSKLALKRAAQAERDKEDRKRKELRFDMQWIKSALHGQAIPEMLDLELAQRAVIRGIRYCDGFATELHGSTPQFTRALNAQAIMNNRVPDMHVPDHFLYCIWHPKTPDQDTCRALLQRYPQMNYQNGRVCAVAGYSNLFRELHLLPEVHIAEEARDNDNLDLFDAIVSQPIKYAVFNDYKRTYEPDAPRPTPLNGDTCVRSMLEIKQRYHNPPEVMSKRKRSKLLTGPLGAGAMRASKRAISTSRKT